MPDPHHRSALAWLIVVGAPCPEDLGKLFRLEMSPAIIGRSPDADVPLATRGAAPQHAQVECRGESWWIVDLGLTNRVYVNDVRVTERQLSAGDAIRVGSYTLAFGFAPPDDGAKPRACLVMLGHKQLVPRGMRIDLVKGLMTCGRSRSEDIALDGDAVAGSHCRFEARADGWWVVDNVSPGGTYVNDEQISPERRLLTGDAIKVGGVKLRFLSGRDLDGLYRREVFDLWAFDDLTGVHSVDYSDDLLFAVCKSGVPAALLFADVDRLTAVNEQFGHLAGDAVLRDLAATVGRNCGPIDVVGRHGGGFVVVMPRRDLPSALATAEALRVEAAAQIFQFQANSMRITLSVGVAVSEEEDEGTTTMLIARAQLALGEAKAAGGNRVAGR